MGCETSPSTQFATAEFVAALLGIFIAVGFGGSHAAAQTMFAPTSGSSVVSLTPPAGSICVNCVRPQATVAPAPPLGFNPLTASDAQLAGYGFPPRPDASASPGAYAVWAKIVSVHATRVVPQLQMTNLSNGPARMASVGRAPVTAGSTSAVGVTTTNWSGYVITDNKNPFKAAKTYVYATFVVPAAQQPFGTCSSTEYYDAQWVGIDGMTVNGVGSSDVLQAGIEADANCAAGKTSGYYAAWYEWYPDNWVRLTNPAIAPGDTLDVYVWNTSTTSGDFYLLDETKNVSASLAFNAPSGTSLTGNSVEWIVEAPFVGRSQALLTNYVSNPWYLAHATLATGAIYSPASAPTGNIYSLTMTESGQDVSYADTSTNNDLTYVAPTGKSSYFAGTALWFFDEGIAR